MATTPRPQYFQPVSDNISDAATNQGMNIAESTSSSKDAVMEPHVAPDAALPPESPSASNVQATAMADPSSPATGHSRKRSSLAELCGDPTLANALAFVAVVIALADGGLQVKYLIWTGRNDALQACQNQKGGTTSDYCNRLQSKGVQPPPFRRRWNISGDREFIKLPELALTAPNLTGAIVLTAGAVMVSTIWFRPLMRTPTRQFISMARVSCHGIAIQGEDILRYSQHIITPNELLASSRKIRRIYTLLANQFSSGVQDIKNNSGTGINTADQTTSESFHEILLTPMVHEENDSGHSVYSHISDPEGIHGSDAEDMRIRDNSGENDQDPSVTSVSNEFSPQPAQKSSSSMVFGDIAISPQRGVPSKAAAQSTSYEHLKDDGSSFKLDLNWKAEFKRRVGQQRLDDIPSVKPLVPSPCHDLDDHDLDDPFLSISSASLLCTDSYPESRDALCGENRGYVPRLVHDKPSTKVVEKTLRPCWVYDEPNPKVVEEVLRWNMSVNWDGAHDPQVRSIRYI